MQDLQAESIQNALHTEKIGRALAVVEQISSTNTVLRTDYADAPDGFVLVAGEQSAGRGRQGRVFSSPADTGVYFTIKLDLSLPTEQLPLVTVAAAVAAARGIAQSCGLMAEIKWVNDIFYQGKKLAGILTEGIFGADGRMKILVGIGINVQKSPLWSDEARRVAGAIGDFVEPPRRDVLVAEVLTAFEPCLALLRQGRQDELIAVYRALLCCIGADITVQNGQQSYAARCIGLDAQAHLLVRREDGTEESLAAGEIRIRL